MSRLEFHRCNICGALFWHLNKTAYCVKCIPCVKGETGNERKGRIYTAINDRCSFAVREYKKNKERERWRKRMENPVFREKERLRSLERARKKKNQSIVEYN